MERQDPEQKKFDTLRNDLDAALVSDALDILGYHKQVMSAQVRPLYDDATVVGRARIVIAHEIDNFSDHSYLSFLDFINSLKSNDVIVISDHSNMRYGLCGELLAGAAQLRGATGMISDGALRDIRQLADLKFPTFAAGINMSVPIGRATVLINASNAICGDVLVNSGDIVFGDKDGVVIIPQGISDQAISLAAEVKEKEGLFRERLMKGDDVRGSHDEILGP